MMKEFSMHILDIVQNSIRAEAKKIVIEVIEDEKSNYVSFSIKDDGCGMSREMLEAIKNPFTTSRTTRKVGLGIPMLDQTCQMCGGHLSIDSEPNRGTRLIAKMDYNNIDRPPMGNMIDTIYIIIMMNPTVEFKYTHKINGKEFTIDTEEIKEILGDDVPINEPSVLVWLKENITECMNDIKI